MMYYTSADNVAKFREMNTSWFCGCFIITIVHSCELEENRNCFLSVIISVLGYSIYQIMYLIVR